MTLFHMQFQAPNPLLKTQGPDILQFSPDCRKVIWNVYIYCLLSNLPSTGDVLLPNEFWCKAYEETEFFRFLWTDNYRQHCEYVLFPTAYSTHSNADSEIPNWFLFLGTKPGSCSVPDMPSQAKGFLMNAHLEHASPVNKLCGFSTLNTSQESLLPSISTT